MQTAVSLDHTRDGTEHRLLHGLENLPAHSLLATLDWLSAVLDNSDILSAGVLQNAQVRIRHRQSRTPAIREIEAVTPRSDGSLDLYINTMNLVGPLGRFPAEIAGCCAAALEWADPLLHQLISLLYRQYRTTRQDSPGFRRLLTVFGVPAAVTESLLPMAALFAGPCTSAGLAKLLTAQLELPVSVQPVVGGWERRNGELAWDAARECQVRLGPLARPDFERFLPGQRELGQLLHLIRCYLGPLTPVSLQFVLRGRDVRLATQLDRGDVFVLRDNPADSVVLVDRHRCRLELDHFDETGDVSC